MVRVFLLCGLCWWAALLSMSSHGDLEQAQLTISESQLQQGPVSLSGWWAFDWQQLHTDFSKPVHDGLMLPGLWHRQGPYEHTGYGTLRQRLLLPEGLRYFLRVPDAPSAIAIWVNGKAVFSRGVVATHRDAEVPEFGPSVIALPKGHQYDIVVHISNFHHKDGGIWHNFLLADERHVAQLQRQPQLWDAMIFTFLIVVSLFFLFAGLNGQGNACTGFFVAFVWTIALRSVLVGERIAYEFMTDVSWVWLQRWEHILLLLALPLYLHYFQAFFNLARSWFVRIVTSLSLLAVVATLSTPASWFTYLGWLAQGMGVVTVVYCAVRLSQVIRQKHAHGMGFLISFVGWSLLVIHDYFYTHLIIQSRPLAQFGLLFFVGMQSYLLWHARAQQNDLLHYVKNAIDQKSHVLKEMLLLGSKHGQYVQEKLLPVLREAQSDIAKSQSEYKTLQGIIDDLDHFKDHLLPTEAIDLNELALSLKPYFHGMQCQLKNINVKGQVVAHREGLQQVLLMLGRLGEVYGLPSRLTLSVTVDTFHIRLRLLGKLPMNATVLPELNLAHHVLLNLNAHLTQKTENKHIDLMVALPLVDVPSEKTRPQVVGYEQGHVLLIDGVEQTWLADVLGAQYRLVFAAATLANVKKYRPALIWATMDACEHISTIRQQYPHLPIIAEVDGYRKAELSELIKIGVTDYVVQPVVAEEWILKLQLALGKPSVIDQTEQFSDIREITVALVRQCIQFWQNYTGKSKAELAEKSRLWRVYMDGSTAKTRTLDKYLSLQSLPKNPRWDTVSRTAAFILDECPLEHNDKQQLQLLMKQFNQMLSS